jgi:hypothetical protein
MKTKRINKVMLLTGLVGACSDRPAGAASPLEHDEELAIMVNTEGGETPRQQLPFAHGRTFATLDDYLTHLRERAGPVGQPWYREIRPGVYQLVTSRAPPGEPEIRTREELMRRFGFRR